MVNRTVAGRHGVRLVLAAALTVAISGFVGPEMVSAAPTGDTAVTDGGSYLVDTRKVKGRESRMRVYSASMDRTIPLQVITPVDTSVPAPTLYLLNGAGGGEDSASWQANTDVAGFFADKHVNVVSPLRGKFSYYTDWVQPDPVLGANKWTTFLTEELPPIIDEALGTNGVNAIAGISMAGTSVLSLAQSAPDLYEGVGAYSGCAMTSTNPGKTYVRAVVEAAGGGDTENMWGPVDGPLWAANDPYVNAEKLRGLDIYVSSGSGLPGPGDRLDTPGVDGNALGLAGQIIVGGVIEAATNQCTHALARRLHELGIPATFDFRPTGTHSWWYWQEDLKKSWPTLARSMGL
ncbi:esterase [Rhodococcus sp. WMMA185]|uniref:alpha/beta hydrolase n=1 Tax=Rhodococcus sp. WMMA185 TaxID=679318 RepID=UPI000878B675|nr:alpha/beta hydrolase family protein [Rhodococcus sp. WMMA185]AOW93264.1 esterase [Rhodococcus sp. WMMA185]